jgi:catechol 2,3-dioxygenase-like lactoylglutathione lyase family enzyme
MKANYPKMHVSLYVNKLEESIQFYNSFFGQEAAKIEVKYAKYILDEPALIISFIENPSKVQPYFGHLGFQVESVEELNKKLALAKASGIVSSEEMSTSCCYALQDKFWLHDPDGIAWEVYYFHKDVTFNDPHYALEENKQMCCSAAENQNVKEACC